MRYSKEHKQQTRARIVQRAAVKLREKGAHGIGVAELMQEAGLTHGGFYAHFASRDELLTAAVVEAMDRSIVRWRKLAAATPPDQRLATIVETYLRSAHRDDLGRGCALPALGAEIARGSAKTRKAFAGKLDELIEAIAEQAPDSPRADARKQATAILATMIGTLIMARIAGSGEASDEVLESGKAAALAITGKVSRRPAGGGDKPA